MLAVDCTAGSAAVLLALPARVSRSLTLSLSLSLSLSLCLSLSVFLPAAAAAMDAFSAAELQRASSSDELLAATAAPASRTVTATAAAATTTTTITTTTAAASLSPSAEYVDIDVSQPGDMADSTLSAGGMLTVEEELEELRIDRVHQQQQQQQQQQRPQWQQLMQPSSVAAGARHTAAAAAIEGEQPAMLRRHEPGDGEASEGDEADDEDEWARDDEEADYNDAVLSSRLDGATSLSAATHSASSSFSYSSLTSYIPASISALPSSLSSLPSSLSSLPSTLSSLPSHLPSLASLPSLPSLPTTTASSASPAPAPLVTFKSISSFTYASHVYYMLLLATPSSLVLYHIDPSPLPASNLSSSIVVKRVSAYHDEAMAHLSSCCFLTPSVSLLSSPDLLLPSPLTPPTHLGPLLALTSSASSGSSSFPSSSVRIYSSFLSKAVHLLRFRSRVLRVLASTSTFAVLLDNEIVLYATPQSASVDELRFDLLYSVRCAAGSEYGVCALGPRWLAYASEGVPASGGQSAAGKSEGEESPLLVATSTTPKLLPGSAAANSSSPFALPPSASHSSGSSPLAASSLLSSLPSSSDSLSTISRNIASSLYNLGDQGRRSISNYLTPLPAESGSSSSLSSSSSPLSSAASPSPSSSAAAAASGSSSSPSSSAGTVIVRDVLSQRVLCHLKAHSSAIAALAFDPTGTLLVTAGQHGQYIHIYQLVTLPTSSSASSPPSASSLSSPVGPLSSFSPRFLYRLFRGVTHATLRSLSFSSDSNWFACTSLKGTTHIFAVNPHGGPINVSTHAPPPVPMRDERDDRDEDGVSDHGHPLTLNAIHRIRGNFPSSAATSPVSSSFLHLSLPSSASHIDHLALLTSTAEVLLYRLSTVYRPPPPTASNSLALLSSAQQHRRRKETVVGESDSIGQMMGGVVEGMGVVVGHVVHELGRAVKNYQSGSSSAAAAANDASAVAAEEASQRKLDLVVTAVAHIHLAADATDADGLVFGGRRRDNDSGGGSGSGGGAGGARDKRVSANPNFFRDIEQLRHATLSRSSGHSSASSSSSHSSHAASAWLANVELRPYSSPELPLWASPQFTLFTYAAPSISPSAPASFGPTAAPAASSASSSSSPLSDSAGGGLSWYSEPSVAALYYDKYAGLSSVRVFDGSSLGYTEVKLETEQVEWSDAHTAQQQQQPHSYHSAYSAAAELSHTAALGSSAVRADSDEQAVGRRAGQAKQQSDEHKAVAAAGAAAYNESGVSELLARRVQRFAANGPNGYSPPLSAISHRSLSPSVSSDRDSEEQMVM